MAISCGVKGLASARSCVTSALYSEVARQGFQQCNRVAVGWDGSTHGAKDVQMGYAINLDTTFTAYLKPVATLPGHI